jgi:phosphoserine phosphatase
MPGSFDPPLDIPEPLARCLLGEGSAAFLKRLRGPPGVAAFDADGTLWEGDIGEEVLRELIARRHLVEPPVDPWGEYEALVKRDPAAGFAFSGRVMHGLSEALLRELSAEIFARTVAAQVFPGMRWLLGELRRLGWEIYVVSASNRWSIEVAVATLGVPATRVRALDVEVVDGKLTERVYEPIPTLGGKATLLLAAAGRAPDLAFGNSVLDVPLLLSAGIPVAVGSVSDAPRNRFLTQALRRNWARIEVQAGA